MKNYKDRVNGRGCSRCHEMIIAGWSDLSNWQGIRRKCGRCGYLGNLINMMKIVPIGCLFMWDERRVK